jgi:hypothetical protein
MVEALSIVAAVATVAQTGPWSCCTSCRPDTPVRDAVSDYGVGRYRGWFWAQAIWVLLGTHRFLTIAHTQPD